jgi:hypothetical protein
MPVGEFQEHGRIAADGNHAARFGFIGQPMLSQMVLPFFTSDAILAV